MPLRLELVASCFNLLLMMSILLLLTSSTYVRRSLLTFNNDGLLTRRSSSVSCTHCASFTLMCGDALIWLSILIINHSLIYSHPQCCRLPCNNGWMFYWTI